MENKKLIYGFAGAIFVTGMAIGIYFMTRKPKEESSDLLPKDNEKPKDAPEGEQKGGTEKNPSGCSTAGFDYSNTVDSGKHSSGQPNSRPETVANKQGNKYLLGQNVIVKRGQKIFRVDANGCDIGSMTTQVRTALGHIWHIQKSGRNVTIKSKSGFSYPYYKVNIENLE